VLDERSINGRVEAPHAGWVRISLSSNYLYSAFSLAALCADLETGGDIFDDQLRLRHRSLAMASVTSAVAFLESCINELFTAAAEDGSHFRLAGEGSRQRLAALWGVERFRLARVLEKYEVALQLAEAPALDRGAKTYQDARLVVQLRNALIHYAPRKGWIEAGATEDLDPDEFAKRLRGRFPENAWAARYMVISTGDSPAETVYPFFPERCLGAGCSHWAARAALQFADEFFEHLDAPPPYSWVLRHLPSSTA